MSKKLFNFYLEEDQKDKATHKLTELFGETPKGVLASYLRVCVKELVDTPVQDLDKELINKITREYVTSQTLNKRSCL